MKLSNKIILAFILVAGTLLRFYRYAEIPFAHDEFSALFRTQFSSFSELIQYGVMPDGHPAGIQVFLYYWVQLVGMNEWAIKLPFTLAGIASIWLTFKIGKAWFNETTGLLASTLIAGLQYPIMYSITARPYISGMYFGLMMVYCFTRLVKETSNRPIIHWIGFVLFGALCAYNHHFSLLFAGLVVVFGTLLVPKHLRLKYLLASLGMAVLYIPHLSIFFHQLSGGGVEGWLAKPTQEFFKNFVQYLFHGSFTLILIVGALVGLGIATSGKPKWQWKKWTFFLAISILPALIGYIYSIRVNSVLQYSVLIFGFPFALIALFGVLKQQKPMFNLIMVAIILFFSITSLTGARKHYQLVTTPHYKHILTDMDSAKVYGDVLYLVDSHRKISAYYKNKFEHNTPFYWLDEFKSELELREFLEIRKDSFHAVYVGAWSNTNPNFIPVIQEFYPNKKWQNNYVGGCTQLFSNYNYRSEYVITHFPKSDDRSGWSVPNKSMVSEAYAPSRRYCTLDSLSEWSPSFSRKLDSMYLGDNSFIDISVQVKLDNQSRYSLVAVIEGEEGNIHWSEMDFGRLVNRDSLDYQWVHHSIKLSDINWQNKNAEFKTFVWNKDKDSLEFKDFTVRRRIGNPYQYGFSEIF